MWQLDPRFHTPGWAERRLRELREEKQAKVAPFVHELPKLEKSLERIADALEYFMVRQQEQDMHAAAIQRAAIEEIFAGRSVDNG